MNKQKILEKIQKILRKADKTRNNSFEEAEIALAMAHKLLKQYHLNINEILVDDLKNKKNNRISEKIAVTFKSLSVPKWMIYIVSTVNLLTETKNLISYTKKDLSIIFVGDYLDVEISVELFNFLRNCVTKLSSKYMRTNKFSYKEWRSFAEGCSSKLLTRAKNLKLKNERSCNIDDYKYNENEKDQDEEECFDEQQLNNQDDNHKKYDLILFSKNEKISEYIEEKYKQLKETKIKKCNNFNKAAFFSGYKEADKIPLKILKQVKEEIK